jgi:hypothetical protein
MFMEYYFHPSVILWHDMVVLGDVMVIVLIIGSKVRGFKPGRERWIFKGDKNPQYDFRFPSGGSKAFGPMS